MPGLKILNRTEIQLGERTLVKSLVKTKLPTAPGVGEGLYERKSSLFSFSQRDKNVLHLMMLRTIFLLLL